jgi:transposase InsO family protein
VAHRSAKLTVHGRRLLVERMIEQGWPAARAAEAQGVSVATAYKWLRRFKAKGDAGLADRSSRPARSPRRLSPQREQAIICYRAAHRVGPHRIGWALGEARSTVHAVLKRAGAARLVELDRPTGQVVRYQRQRPGELVHVDIHKQGRIPDGGGHRMLGRAGGHRDRRHGMGYDFIHVAVDDYSRLAYVEIHADERADTAVRFTSRALAWFQGVGVSVQQIMSDNGACYRSRAFRQLLDGQHITHTRTRPYRPQTNGKAERFNRTLGHEWAYTRLYPSNQDRLQALPAWLHTYNHHRPHTALAGRSPMDLLNNVPGNYT